MRVRGEGMERSRRCAVREEKVQRRRPDGGACDAIFRTVEREVGRRVRFRRRCREVRENAEEEVIAAS